MQLFRAGDVLLFQGDSITHAERNEAVQSVPNDHHALGWGYAKMCAAALLARGSHPGLKIYNRGVSGDCVFDLDKRWRQDCLDLEPNVLSILIGANDWGRYFLEGWIGQSLEDYGRSYRALLVRTRAALPNVRLILGEPFHIHPPWMKPEHDHDMRERQALVRTIAAEFEAVFVPFGRALVRAFEQAPPATWTFDGLHPNLAGFGLMTRTWLRAVLGDDA